ncbi:MULTISPECIES: hypothetical protein [unclassified Roseitalea]|uniref:hypothetical protein n=1 Tax=unclassified Roseitalea TaxID=2639107 RepID=UPI002740231A|nr:MULTISPECIES: hypothetical protein [unclassified Roseitalea]
MRRIVLTALAATLAAAGTAGAQDDRTQGRELSELVFGSIDLDGKGHVHMGDMERFRAEVFDAMDADGDLKITYDEFSAWDPGYAIIAQAEGQPQAYATATRIVFSFWDRNADFVLTEAEMRFAVSADFRRADLNDDGLLSEQEFLQSFGVIVALRAAIRPDIDFRVQ